MKNELVKDWMTPNPITVSPDVTLPDAHALLKEYGIRRLIVVDADQQVVGIVSDRDVREAQPSDATTLSSYELNYLLAKLTISRIMSKNVLTVAPETSIGEAARLMLEKKIGGLPVLENNRVVGIITESDIFRVVVERFMD